MYSHTVSLQWLHLNNSVPARTTEINEVSWSSAHFHSNRPVHVDISFEAYLVQLMNPAAQ